MQVVDTHTRILGSHAIHSVLPEPAGVYQNVVLVHQGQLLAIALGCNIEGIANGAFNAVGGVHRNLIGNLVLGANANGATVTHIGALGAFANHHEIHTARFCQWACHPGK